MSAEKKWLNFGLFFWILFLSCVFGGLLLHTLKIRAQSVGTGLTIANSPPIVSGLQLVPSSTFTLTSGGVATATATFNVIDNNGCTDIDSASTKTAAYFYLATVSGGMNCTSNPLNCYKMTCVKGTCTNGITSAYTCTAPMQFYANSGNWILAADPADSAGFAIAATASATINPSFAISVATSSISYGSLSLGSNTGSNDPQTQIINTGNVNMNLQVSGYGATSNDGYAMVCTPGNIPVQNEKFATSSIDYLSMTSLATSSYSSIATEIVPGSSSSSYIYWGIAVPATGSAGSCSGNLSFTPVQG